MHVCSHTATLHPLLSRGFTPACVLCLWFRTAITEGYRLIDCAAYYKNEETVGQGMAEFIRDGHRDELFVIGKIWNDAHRPQLARCLPSFWARKHPLAPFVN